MSYAGDVQHELLVANIAATVKCFEQRKEPFRIYHGSTSTTRPPHSGNSIDISGLSRVLQVDSARRLAIVEPNVTMDALLRATLPHGLMPPVVIDSPGLTVGGCYAGSAAESSAFRYGCFDQIVVGVEMILGDGQVIIADKYENSDLFKGASGALGTLGITTRLTLDLIPAKNYVQLEYRQFCNIHDAVEATISATTEPENDFVDAIVFSKTHCVVMAGRLTDHVPPQGSVQTFSHAWDLWFYTHVQQRPRGEDSIDHIPLQEYLFRYDRGGYWMGREAFRYFWLPDNRVMRWLFDDLMHVRMLFRELQGGNLSFQMLMQDLCLPQDTAEELIDWCDTHLGIWPLWLLPLRPIAGPTFHPQAVDEAGVTQPILNVGVWGKVTDRLETQIMHNRAMEKCVAQLGGRKVLYAHAYYPETEFWSLYSREWYDTLRRKYKATTLPTVYDKAAVSIDPAHIYPSHSLLGRLWHVWPLPGLLGMWTAVRSNDYRMRGV